MGPLDWTVGAVTSACGGTLRGGALGRIDRVSTDSREDLDGALFVAIAGERFDGHDFAREALAKGAVAAVVDRPLEGDGTLVVVESTSEALLALAAKRRGELRIPVVAITGSTGKTSTKDLVASGIEGAHASPRSYNNEVGVPLTVLGTPDSATALVLEVGSRGRGHIAWLGPAIRPDVAVVTNLGVVHLETFGTTDVLADAKYELVEMLISSGTAVLPADEPRLHRGHEVRTVTFGRGGDVDWSDLSLDDVGRPSFVLHAEGHSHDVTLEMAGAHQTANAAAALGVALALELPVGSFLSGMERATGSDWRMDIHRGRVTVVNDAYNANPQSMEAAMRTVATMAGNRRIAVVGRMAELGPLERAEHIRMGALAQSLGFEVVLIVGDDPGYAEGAGTVAVNATGFEEALDTLRSILEPGDVVLVKASRAAGLEQLALALASETAQ